MSKTKEQYLAEANAMFDAIENNTGAVILKQYRECLESANRHILRGCTFLGPDRVVRSMGGSGQTVDSLLEWGVGSLAVLLAEEVNSETPKDLNGVLNPNA